MAIRFDIYGIDELARDLEETVNKTPIKIRKFMRREGDKLKRRTIKSANSKVNKKTGNLLKGIKRGKYYKYSGNGAHAIRVYAGAPAYHAHLLEKGHKKVLWGVRTNERVQAFNIWQTAGEEFESTYENDCEVFVNDLFDRL